MARTPVSSGVRTGSRSMALMGRRSGLGVHVLQRAATVQRVTVRVHHAAQQAIAHGQVGAAVPPRRQRCSGRPSRGGSGGRRRGTTVAPLARPLHFVGGHQVGAVAREANHLGIHRRQAAPGRVAAEGIWMRQTDLSGTRKPVVSSTRPATRTSLPWHSSGWAVLGR